MNKYSLSLQYLEYLSYSYTGSAASTKQTKLSSLQIIAPPHLIIDRFCSNSIVTACEARKSTVLEKDTWIKL